MKFCQISLTLLASAGFLDATSIVVIMDENKIVVGADARMSGIETTYQETTCKLFEAPGRVLWGTSGMAFIKEGIDFNKLIANSLSSPGSLTKRLAAAEAKVKPYLMNFINSRNYPTDGVVLEIVAAGFVDGRPKVTSLQFVAKGTESGKRYLSVHRAECPDVAPPLCAKTQTFILGLRDELIDRSPADTFPTWAQHIDWLIRTKIQMHPEYVGFPISIAEVSVTGIKWVSPGACDPALGVSAQRKR